METIGSNFLRDPGIHGIVLRPRIVTERKRHERQLHAFTAGAGARRTAAEIPFCHHERWDGSGFPRGLKENEIPMEAQIFSVVDEYDALTAPKPYGEAWAQERATQYLPDQSGIGFNPVIVEAFLRNITSIVIEGGEP